MAHVARAWTATEGPVALGDGVAHITHPAGMEAGDGARWRERGMCGVRVIFPYRVSGACSKECF